MIYPRAKLIHTSIGAAFEVLRHLSHGGISRSLRAARLAMPILMHLPGHFELVRVMSHPNVLELSRHRPKLLYKYLTEYLAADISRRTRLSALTHHYNFMKDRVRNDFMGRLFGGRYVLWESVIDNTPLSISLAYPGEDHDFEGELRLFFENDAIPVYSITLTVVAGTSLGIGGEPVLLIGAVQGAGGKLELIKEATKACDDAPPSFLLAAAEGLATALNIKKLAGVSLKRQVQKKLLFDDLHFRFDYDKFWAPLTDEKIGGFYLLPVPIPEKPLEQVKSNRRSRALRRRALKEQIAQRVQISFQEQCLISPI